MHIILYFLNMHYNINIILYIVGISVCTGQSLYILSILVTTIQPDSVKKFEKFQWLGTRDGVFFIKILSYKFDSFFITLWTRVEFNLQTRLETSWGYRTADLLFWLTGKHHNGYYIIEWRSNQRKKLAIAK